MELAFTLFRVLDSNAAIVFIIHLLIRFSNTKLKHFLKDITDVSIELKFTDIQMRSCLFHSAFT